MLDIGWSELLIIGVVALIVVGPKDLPVMFRTLGRFTAKARNMAREFQRAMDDAAKSAGVDETLKDVRDLTSKKSLGLDALESAAAKFESWKPGLASAKPAAAAAAAGAASAKPASAPTETQGPATRALAEKQAARRAALHDRQAAADAPPTKAASPVRKAVRRTLAKPAADTAPAGSVSAEAIPAAKPKSKPKARKTDQA